MPSASPHSSRRFFLRGALVLLVALCALPSAFAQYEIGSPLVAVADPPVPHPNTTPCTVTLFTNQEFADFNNKPFSYSPTCGAGPCGTLASTAPAIRCATACTRSTSSRSCASSWRRQRPRPPTGS